MFKRTISVILAVLLVFAAASVAFAAEPARETGDGAQKTPVIYFDSETAGWSDAKYIGFHIWEIGAAAFSDWGGKAERGTRVLEYDGEIVIDTPSLVWQFDFAAKGITLEDGKQYGVIFYNDKGGQTYNLLFDTTCLGDTAYCDVDNVYENPEDSSKETLPAFWEHQDPTINGPQKVISSVGNVVGTCIPKSMTAQTLFEDFLVKTLDNARTFSLKDDQKLLDDIGADLGLTADEVKESLEKADVSSSWKYNSSTLEKEHEDPEPQPEGSVISFDANSAGWTDSAYVGFHIWEVGKGSFFEWLSKKEYGSDPDHDGVWSYDLGANGIKLDPAKHYGVIFYNEYGMEQTYNLLFDTACFGDIAYCADDAILENPVDSDKKTKAAYWKKQDPTVNGPEMIVTTIGTVAGVCIPKGLTAFDLFLDFLLYNFGAAKEYSGLTEHQLIENVAKELGLTVEDVKDAIRIAGITPDWNEARSELEHEAIEPGAPTREPCTADIAEGAGIVSADKKYLVINYSLQPEYAYDTVTLTAVPAYGYAFVKWQIEGDYEIADDSDLSSTELTIKAFSAISAHAEFKEEPQTEPMRGDYDSDKEITIMDATRAQNIIAELIERPDNEFIVAVDADKDGELTILDATRIQRVIADLCDWDGNPLPVSEPDELPLNPA